MSQNVDPGVEQDTNRESSRQGAAHHKAAHARRISGMLRLPQNPAIAG